MTIEDLLDDNIFDNPLFLIADEPVDAKLYEWADYGITKVTAILTVFVKLLHL